MDSSLNPEVTRSIFRLLDHDLCTTVKPGGQVQLRSSSSPSTQVKRYYPPDQLDASGHRSVRSLLRSCSSFIALLQAIGEQRLHVLYYADKNRTRSGCFSPEVRIKVRQTLRELITPVKAPTWVAIEQSGHKRSLHLHIMTRRDMTLPPEIEIHDESGKLLVKFGKVGGRSIMESAHDLGIYLRKSPHTGAREFNPLYPADDPRQPFPFREALDALKTGEAEVKAMGLGRFPPGRFGISVPRLTPEQRAEVLQLLLEAQANPRPVQSISRAEWMHPDVKPYLPPCPHTFRAEELQRRALSIILRSRALGISLEVAQSRSRDNPRPSFSTVYRLSRNIGDDSLDRLTQTLQALRLPRGVEGTRLFTGLNRPSKKTKFEN